MNRRWPMLRVMLTAHVSFVLILWLALVALTALATLGYAIWGTVDGSLWHFAATQVPRWIALGLGFDVVNTYLRLHVAHGRTRRDFLRQLWPYAVGLAATLGLLVTIGYLVERGAYALGGVRYRLPFPSWGHYPFEGTEYLAIFGSFTLMFLLWTLSGVVLAAAFASRAILGILVVPFVILLVAPIEIRLGWGGIHELNSMTEDDIQFAMPTAVGISLGWAVLACVAIWGIVRAMPMRQKVA